METAENVMIFMSSLGHGDLWEWGYLKSCLPSCLLFTTPGPYLMTIGSWRTLGMRLSEAMPSVHNTRFIPDDYWVMEISWDEAIWSHVICSQNTRLIPGSHGIWNQEYWQKCRSRKDSSPAKQQRNPFHPNAPQMPPGSHPALCLGPD